MGFIREPKGIDFIIQSEPLTEKEKKEINQFIEDYKSKKIKIDSNKPNVKREKQH